MKKRIKEYTSYYSMEPKNACFPAMGKINVKPLPLPPKERYF